MIDVILAYFVTDNNIVIDRQVKQAKEHGHELQKEIMIKVAKGECISKISCQVCNVIFEL